MARITMETRKCWDTDNEDSYSLYAYATYGLLQADDYVCKGKAKLALCLIYCALCHEDIHVRGSGREWSA
jgi:hypothetical protein